MIVQAGAQLLFYFIITLGHYWDLSCKDNLGCLPVFVSLSLSAVIVVFATLQLCSPPTTSIKAPLGASPIGCYLQHSIPSDLSN